MNSNPGAGLAMMHYQKFAALLDLTLAIDVPTQPGLQEYNVAPPHFTQRMP